MTEFNYEEIDFRIPVREGFYRYNQKVSPAYLVTDLGIDWASIVVHRKPGKPDESLVRLGVCHRGLDCHSQFHHSRRCPSITPSRSSRNLDASDTKRR